MRLYPLANLPRQAQLWAWISYDVANQSFTLIINTLLFNIFFTKVVVTDDSRNATLWSVTYALSMGVAVVLSPLVGAIADSRAWKKPILMLTGFGCAGLTCMMGFIPPQGLAIAMLLYIPANALYSLGENMLAAFLPELCERRDFGRVSAFSWGVAYTAALVLLVLTAGAMLTFDLKNPEHWRPLFVFAGIWFLVFSVPTLWRLRERPPTGVPGENLLTVGFVRLGQSLRQTSRFRDLGMLLIASVFYGTAMSVIIFFASIIASEFGFEDVDLVVFTAVITISGVIGTLIPLRWQDRLGHRRMTILLLLLWLATALGFALVAWRFSLAADPAAFPRWPIWVIGNLLGLGLGSLGSANRAFVGYLAPATRTAEIFGLWGMVFKLSAIGTIPFAIVKDKLGTPASLLVLAGFVLVGLILTLCVNESRGAAAARAADEEALSDPAMDERAGAT